MSSPDECGVDGCKETENVSWDVDFEAGEAVPRCPDHYEASTTFWFVPGDHPSLPSAKNWPLECDVCGQEFDVLEGIFGLEEFRYRSRTEYLRCLECADATLLEAFDESATGEPHRVECEVCGDLGEYPSRGGASVVRNDHIETEDHALTSSIDIVPVQSATADS